MSKLLTGSACIMVIIIMITVLIMLFHHGKSCVVWLVSAPLTGLTPQKPHHILTISDLEETRRVRRHPPHSQSTGPRGHAPPPPLGPLPSQITLRAGKSSLPSSPLFPLSATDGLLNSPPSRPGGGRGASSVRCPGNTMTHCTSTFFPQSTWQENSSSFPSPSLSFSPSLPHLPRSRLSFDLSQSDSVEVPHNFLASPEPEDASPPNGTSPQRSSEQQRGEEQFAYGSFHKDPAIGLDRDVRAEVEIEETLVNEGVAMNCERQIVVEGDDDRGEFWGRAHEAHKRKTRVISLPRSVARDDLANSSSDDEMEHYFDFSRTIVSCPASSKDRPKSPSSPSSRPLAQLDGVDDGTDSDASVAANEEAQRVGVAGQAQMQARNKKVPESETANGMQGVHSLLPQASLVGKHTDSSPTSFSALKSSHEPPILPSVTQPSEDNAGIFSLRGSKNPSSLSEQSSDAPPKLLETVLPSPLPDTLPALLTNVPETSCSEALFQGSDLGFTCGTPLILERCEPSPLRENSERDRSAATLLTHGTNSSLDASLNSAENRQTSLTDVVRSAPSVSSDAPLPPQNLVFSCLPTLSQPPLASITLQPVNSPHDSSLDQPAAKLTTLTPVGDLTQALLNAPAKNLPVLSSGTSTTACATVPLPVQPAQQAQPTSLTISTSSSPAAAHPVVVNGYSSLSVQKEAVAEHTISINFSAPRSASDPQQPVATAAVSQALPGHAILTVKEVGGPNVDPTPHVLLVNRLGQIFVKNPESNTFQLPCPTSSSYSCVTQIASLLQSNALSATLAAAGGLSAPPAVLNISPAAVAPTLQSPPTITQLLTAGGNSGGGCTLTSSGGKKKKSAKAAKRDPEAKKAKKKKESSSKKSSKSCKVSGQLAKSGEPPLTAAESAQAIINQAMASNYTPKWGGLQTLSPSSLVLPPDLLIEPNADTCESPPSPSTPPPPPPPSLPPPPQPPASRPRTHVRMKRVSSLSDRIVTKKSRVDFQPQEHASEEEERGKPTFASVSSSRASGVRIKTPTVKGVLNLDKLKEECMSDSASSR